MSYRAPIDEYKFIFDHIVGIDQVVGTERFSDATKDVSSAILSEAGKLCEEVMAPLQRTGDLYPATLENGSVRTSPGYSDAFKAIQLADGLVWQPTLGTVGWDYLCL